jgi:hypothetical protein
MSSKAICVAKRAAAWTALVVFVFLFSWLSAFGLHLFAKRVEHAQAVSARLRNPPPPMQPHTHIIDIGYGARAVIKRSGDCIWVACFEEVNPKATQSCITYNGAGVCEMQSKDAP